MIVGDVWFRQVPASEAAKQQKIKNLCGSTPISPKDPPGGKMKKMAVCEFGDF